MAFNITSWSKRGRNFGRGAPPPPGSVEYAGVGGTLFYGTRPPTPTPTSAPAGEGSRLPRVAAVAALAGAASLLAAGLVSRLRSPEPEDVPDEDELGEEDELDEE